ncbi:uncharacterized protein BDR25DRAFT_221979 [Lindgomyces ingoldianus]|uniref:Uncharacterized protein n=1 Tax=Lindgomyces ingoldianus TaxID=673940 RepID=A0ACB6QYX7_9PLEO|nr:uncharacterized protein BDR25DRAFT_221979 [Lindgomyces ingoldianus]KAF2471992.1 hypothetical protein BDR25DRAFT_221979 [Lindgomyces ingoldianus]
MADALCGPSNALQNFQKHTSVDRTLQQDRLTNRQSPAQGFRSPPGPNAGILDPEFDAFQAGHSGLPQPDFRQLHPNLSHHPPPPQFAQVRAAPDWASDFQQLSISPINSAPIQRLHQPQISNPTSSWHKDFMRQQAPALQAPAFHQTTFGGISGYGMGGYSGQAFQRSSLGPMSGSQVSHAAQGKQRTQEATPDFDEAAFERAFAQAQQDMLEEASAGMRDSNDNGLETEVDQRPAETDPVLLRIKEKRLPVYTAIKLRSEIDLGNSAEALPWLQDLEDLESNGRIIDDASEAKWCVDVLQKIVNRDAPQEIQARAERLITAINERLMSRYPLLATRVPVVQESILEDLRAAGYATRSPLLEQMEQHPEQKKEVQPLKNDDDDMAETAGRLLERVADNTSEKFQNSQFLELMRRLRDREVRVDGDKMVEVSNAQPSNSPLQSTPAPPPEIDPNILDSVSQDFGMVMDSEQEQAFSDPTGGPLTDEVSDQFGYYNVNAAYHR